MVYLVYGSRGHELQASYYLQWDPVLFSYTDGIKRFEGDDKKFEEMKEDLKKILSERNAIQSRRFLEEYHVVHRIRWGPWKGMNKCRV